MAETTTVNRNYQKPGPDGKLKNDVLRLMAALDAIDVDVHALIAALASKAGLDHEHGIATIDGLSEALAGKVDVGYHDALGDLSDVEVDGAANGMALIRQAGKWIPVLLQINNVANLETALSGKATKVEFAALETIVGGKASKAEVTAAISALVGAAPGALDTLSKLADAVGDDPNFATTMTNVLAGKAPLDSPMLTGNPTAPTPALGDNDTSLATTAFVKRAVDNVDLASAKDRASHTGTQDISSTTTGTLPISRGGTGATTETGARGVYTGSDGQEVNFPIGHILLSYDGTDSKNAVHTVRLGPTRGYTISGSASVLAGTWRSRGTASSSTGSAYLFQRVA